MTDLADAELDGADDGPTSWPSPISSDPDVMLPPPPTAATSPRMPAPLVHQPTASSTPAMPISPPATGETLAVAPHRVHPTTTAADISRAETFAAAPALEAPSVPSIVTGPAAILASVDAVAPLDNAAIVLPSVAAVAPPAAAAAVAAQAAAKAAIDSLLMPDQPSLSAKKKKKKKKKKKSGGSRLGTFVLTAAVVGGLGFAGVTYGPGLYDQYTTDEEPSEPAAPMAFPRSRTTAPDVRTATFVLDGLSSGSEASYTITVDFETAVSRVAIDRTDGPDLEVLTFANDALVRRLDSSSWFKMERGAFPLDDQLQQTDWIRMIDDLIPPERRAGVVIDTSTVATVAGVETRHLVLTLDPALLELADETGASLDPIGDITHAAEGPLSETLTADTVAALPETPVADVAEQPATATPSATDPAAGIDQRAPREIETVPVAGDPMSANAIQVELWIDRQGVVRRSVGADVLGANSITILETATEAWVPDYPDATLVKPVTAAALIELGL